MYYDAIKCIENERYGEMRENDQEEAQQSLDGSLENGCTKD